MKRVGAFGLALAPLLFPAARVISQGSPHVRAVALTFDAGADRGYASLILHILERNHIRASFGMTGKWAASNRDLVRRMSRDHDQLINHTYDHRSFTGASTQTFPLTRSQRTWEIERADAIVRAATGLGTKPYFRPPYGDYDPASLALLHKLGYRYLIMWTVDSLGWAHLSASQILRRCLVRTVPGAIFLMHVGSQSADAHALQPLISRLKRQGYKFATVRKLISQG